MRTPHRFALVVFTLFTLTAAVPASLNVGPTPIQQMFVIKEIKPDIERLGVVWDKSASSDEKLMQQLQRGSASTGIKVFLADVGDLKEVAPQFRLLKREINVQAIWVLEGKGVFENGIARSFLIKNATKAGLPIFAPDETWINEGASVSVRKGDAGIELLVNRAAADAMSLQIPAKYVERTQYLALN